ncbi:hypothetical protein M422DRAFT_50822 [Sphaerobolus stellatus SS14]|uniref:Ubiquitin-like protease family profile domain-containing protein n=1 Tax=Sphaerobolus stellatus (strain SS14) TaxID=990650 RepID=A0A0C9U205_SPHS4|nr:hypothetical protein M422DRAFT_50822 [Sphaerobolus stellatus SS14]
MVPTRAGPPLRYWIFLVQDLQRFEPGEYFSDEIINFGLALWYERHLSSCRRSMKLLALSTFFWDTYVKNGYTKVSKWNSHIDVFTLDLIIIPVNKDNHWFAFAICHLAACLGNERPFYILGLDSLAWGHAKIRDEIRDWIAAELMARHSRLIDSAMIISLGAIQPNYVDCGPYMLHNIDRLVRSFDIVLSHINSDGTSFSPELGDEDMEVRCSCREKTGTSHPGTALFTTRLLAYLLV